LEPYLVLIVSKIVDLERELARIRGKQPIGFVPTMGALHAGHLSLIKQSLENKCFTVCSIFVNPTQFNDKGDLDRYPRTPELDISLLKSTGCELLFMPEAEEVYPKGTPVPSFDLGYMETILEGAFRPGHFKGVAQVVNRLFELVRPDQAFFGRKDFQQLMIIRQLVKMTGRPVKIIAGETVREADGLAMSSRNRLLSIEQRSKVGIIYKTLLTAGKLAKDHSIAAASAFVESEINGIQAFRLEYFEIREAETLLIPTHARAGNIALIAMFVGKIRLIDNITID